MKDALGILSDDAQPGPRRIEAARALGEARDRSAIDRMLVVTERSDALLLRAIVDALKAMGAHEVFVERLRGPDPAARAEAARKLSKLQDPRATEALIAALKDPEVAVRRAAVYALSFLPGTKSFDALGAALRDADPETRAYAAAGLGRSTDPRAPMLLRAAREAEEDPVVQDFIDGALRKVGTKAE